ncbi:hypothetical protein GIB67_037459 [Kingdonia uniflora]|uniref:Pentatricopeptide repeat-containing protein n=1 Tax=Kingdonia uniflora TaxID=39325 RepID=A0A7J7NIE6_9MAGN|nr:hypothetical protein GIB67_037459 [Kingdonia uniflora]
MMEGNISISFSHEKKLSMGSVLGIEEQTPDSNTSTFVNHGHSLPLKDTLVWTTMLSAFGKNGQAMFDVGQILCLMRSLTWKYCQLVVMEWLLLALDFIEQISLKPSFSVWSTTLYCCRLYGNVELAQIAANKLLELNPENENNCVVLSNMYANMTGIRTRGLGRG